MSTTAHLPGIRLAKLRRSLVAVLVVAGLAPAALLIQAEPALALTCRPGYVCVYDNAGWGTLLLEIPGNTNSRVYFAENRKNRASSWSNNSAFNWCARNDLTLQPDAFLFSLFDYDDQYYVGDSRNDRADYIYPC